MIPLRSDSGGGAVHGDSPRVTHVGWSALRGAVVSVVVRASVYLELVSLSTRLVNAVTCVAVAVDDLSCVGNLLLPGHKVVCCLSETGLDGHPIFVVGEELAELD